jgi:hypothetical protein
MISLVSSDGELEEGEVAIQEEKHKSRKMEMNSKRLDK